VPMLELFRRMPVTLRGHDFLVRDDVVRGLGVTPCALDDAFDGTDGVLIITDHPSYARIDVDKALSRMRRPALVYDCWRVLPADQVRRVDGIRYASIGLT
jgi:UDP-N-acetyl-D-mannosaminuronic acid dehydrogenase